MRQSNQVVGSIHLYGTILVGYGWLATALHEGQRAMLGTGEPKRMRSATECLFAAARAIVETRVWDSSGLVEIHYDFAKGPKMAIEPLANVPPFGDLAWEPAPVYEISADALIAASESA